MEENNNNNFQQPNNNQPPYQQPPFQQPPMQYPSPNTPPANGMGIASLVLGIIAIVSFCWWFVSIPCGIIGLILGGVAKSKGNKSGVTTAGIVLNIIGLVLAVIFLILLLIGINFLQNYNPFYRSDINDIMNEFDWY